MVRALVGQLQPGLRVGDPVVVVGALGDQPVLHHVLVHHLVGVVVGVLLALDLFDQPRDDHHHFQLGEELGRADLLSLEEEAVGLLGLPHRLVDHPRVEQEVRVVWVVLAVR
jgi:hypothetical protein